MRSRVESQQDSGRTAGEISNEEHFVPFGAEDECGAEKGQGESDRTDTAGGLRLEQIKTDTSEKQQRRCNRGERLPPEKQRRCRSHGERNVLRQERSQARVDQRREHAAANQCESAPWCEHAPCVRDAIANVPLSVTTSA